MKMKPLRAEKTFEDNPRFKKGPQWRETRGRKSVKK
jgi:hypothetical protein